MDFTEIGNIRGAKGCDRSYAHLTKSSNKTFRLLIASRNLLHKCLAL